MPPRHFRGKSRQEPASVDGKDGEGGLMWSLPRRGDGLFREGKL